jgi:hypothetical protein
MPWKLHKAAPPCVPRFATRWSQHTWAVQLSQGTLITIMGPATAFSEAIDRWQPRESPSPLGTITPRRPRMTPARWMLLSTISLSCRLASGSHANRHGSLRGCAAGQSGSVQRVGNPTRTTASDETISRGYPSQGEDDGTPGSAIGIANSLLNPLRDVFELSSIPIPARRRTHEEVEMLPLLSMISDGTIAPEHFHVTALTFT